jgi:putative peptidoglycan lipid II flippase
VLVIAAPLLLHLWLHGNWYQPDHAALLHSTIVFARWCLPQIFFYGMYVLIGQLLNARGSFGPMMWAPIANNVISIAVLVAYLIAFGTTGNSGYSGQEETLLGLGSTLGIVAQFVVLIPALRAAGFHYKPRWDFRGVGLSHTARLGVWTILFVIVNQIAFLVITSLAAAGSSNGGSGYTVYSNAWLVAQTPHSIITVSLATAILPMLSRYASDHDAAGVKQQLGETMRNALALIVPIVALLPILAGPVSRVLFGYGRSHSVATIDQYAPTLAWFAPGLLLWTIQYLVLRAFYAYELNRQALYIQVVIAAVNVAAAVALVHAVSSKDTAAALAAAYSLSYLAGTVLSVGYLVRRLGGWSWAEPVRFGVRIAVVSGLAALVTYVLDVVIGGSDTILRALLTLVVAGGAGGITLIVAARVFRLVEITSIVDSVTRRLPGLR